MGRPLLPDVFKQPDSPAVLLRMYVYHYEARFRPYPGRFWGVEKAFPQFEDKKGVSLALLNTSKGEKLFQAVLPQLEAVNTAIECCVKGNPNLEHPSSCKQPVEQFWKEYETNGFGYLVNRYGVRTAKERVKSALVKGLEKRACMS